MVRVISVHHFTNQDIQTVEQPTACTVALPNRLLLALTSNCVEVRNLSNESEVLFSFPTVDEVVQIVHSIHGDYIATMETKFNRQNKETNFVRVYINWDSIATMQQSKMTSSGVSLGSSECGMVQPMRARIAGRVTPTTNQSELGSLEMIEIPVKRNPNNIECCQVSGNLIILSQKLITLYAFQVRTHDISKLRFIDFEELPISVELSYCPTKIATCENYIACMNRDTTHVFRIVQNKNKDSHNNINDTDFSFLYNSGPIDYKKLVNEETLNPNKEKITVNLPSILKDNSVIHKNNPFTFCDKDISATVKSNTPLESKNSPYKIENLIQLKLVPIVIESAQRLISEEFKCMLLKPCYIDESLNKTNNSTDCDNKFLRSDYRRCLNNVVFMIATQQEGYLYQFNDTESTMEKDNCIALYPFTAPVHKLIMEDYFLHALTETGLESYTLRIGHQLCRNFEIVDNVNVACPSISDSVCLVGLRPFLGVEQLLLAENHLVLLANSESSPTHSVSSNSSSNASFWTLYNLELPTPKTIFNDISIVANVHRFTSAQTYCHLLSEAHMILRLALLLKKWRVVDENVKLIILAKSNLEDIVETYRTSCALLGDHYILCTNEEDYKLAVPYYKMARIMPVDVLKRVKKVQEQANSNSTKGLMNYMKRILLEVKTGPDADLFFGSTSKQNFAETILDLLENYGYEDLPNLILRSKILREYSTDKLIYILNEKFTEDDSNMAEKYLALSILYIQKCNLNRAQESIDHIYRRSCKLFNILVENYDLLFETTHSAQNRSKGVTTFSELAILLINVLREKMSKLFVYLITEKKLITLHKMIKVFLEYLPSSIGSDNNCANELLQDTLELYFQQYFSRPENVDLTKISYERGACEAMKLLVRSYLSQLQILQMREENSNNEEENFKDECDLEDQNDDTDKDRDQEKFGYNKVNNTPLEDREKPRASYLFSNLRYEYLDKLPPFQVEITAKLYESCLEDFSIQEESPKNYKADFTLMQLQALLCSQVVPKQVITEVNAFLAVNENLRGSYAIQSITMNVNDAVLMLVDVCPQCLLQFGKDRFNRPDEWKFLIATIQRRILKLSQNENLKRICFFHKKILKDILTHVASSLTLDQLVLVLPQRFSTTNSDYINSISQNCDNNISENDAPEHCYSENDLDILKEIQNYEPYVMICKETMHANQINKLITTTGQQLLSNLNL